MLKSTIEIMVYNTEDQMTLYDFEEICLPNFLEKNWALIFLKWNNVVCLFCYDHLQADTDKSTAECNRLYVLFVINYFTMRQKSVMIRTKPAHFAFFQTFLTALYRQCLSLSALRRLNDTWS